MLAQGDEDFGGVAQTLARRFGRADGDDQVEGGQGRQRRRRGLAPYRNLVRQASRLDTRLGALGQDPRSDLLFFASRAPRTIAVMLTGASMAVAGRARQVLIVTLAPCSRWIAMVLRSVTIARPV